jgi:hypothetical protein
MNKLDYDSWQPASNYIAPEIAQERNIDNVVYRLNGIVEYRTSFKHFTDTNRVSIWIYDINGNIVKKDYVSATMYSMDIKVYAYKLMERLSQNRIVAPKKAPITQPILSKRLYSLYLGKITAKHRTISNNRYITDKMRSQLIKEIVNIIDMVKSKYGVDLF